MSDLIPIRRHGGMPVVVVHLNKEGWAIHGSHWNQAKPFAPFTGELTTDELKESWDLWNRVFYPASKAGRTIAQIKERNGRNT